MNSVPSCECCRPAYCTACVPQCPVPPTCSSACGIMKKAEPQNKRQPVRSTKNCAIFGGHDTNPFPEYPGPARRIKVKDENRNSLGSPIGLVATNVNFKTEGNPPNIVQARYATYLKAFARLHLNAETTWNSTLIDDIMKEGFLLYTASEKEDNYLESPPDIYTANEKNILREFEMGGYNFQVELMQKFKLNTSAAAGIGSNGDGNTDELSLEDLKTAMKSFFRQHKYCLLSVGSFYIMIWHSRDVYFVFDVCGRRVTDFQVDEEQGVAMLICLHTLENVRHLISNLSALQKADPICMREMKIVKVTTPSGQVVQRDFGKRVHQYQVVNDDYAYVNASLHLTLNKADLLRNRSALPVCITAMVVSQIDHPATWNTKIIDKILCFAVNFGQACWEKCLVNDPINVTEFPDFFDMGQFRVSIELVARKYEGTWRCVPGFKYSALAQAIERAFKVGDQKLLVQINYQMYAAWKQHGFIYLLDPYRHRILGQEGDSDIYEQIEKSATVRMFRSFEVFMNVFNHVLLDSNRTSKFYIHVLKIKNIDFDGELISINEHICFDEAEAMCQKALGEISDYEDEDLWSDLDEMELKTSSSEAEDILEEEAGGAGEAEEIEDYESSSSGEEGGGHQKKGKSTKGSKSAKEDKSVKGGKGKSGGKGDKNPGSKGKGGKGKGAEDDEGGKKLKKGVDDESSDKENSKDKKKKRDDVGGKSKKDTDPKNKEENEATDGNGEAEKVGKDNTNKDKDKKIKDKEGVDDKNVDKSKNKKIYNDKKGLSKEDDMDNDKNEIGKDGDKDGNTKHLKQRNIQNMYKKDLDINGGKAEIDKNADKDKSGKDNYAKFDTDKNKGKGTEKDKVINKEQDKDKYLGKGKNNDNDKQMHKNLDNDKDKRKYQDGDEDKKKYKEKNNLKVKDKNHETNKENALLHKDSNPKIYGSFTDLKDKVDEYDFDGAEADDESEDCFLKDAKLYCSGPNLNRYPGYFKCPADMAVVGSKSGSYASICKLLQAGFKLADRILTMTAWGNFVVFRCLGQKYSVEKNYFLFDGCTCNIDRFRHLDLSIGTAGLICFKHLHNVIEYIRRIRKIRNKDIQQLLHKETANAICHQYCCY